MRRPSVVILGHAALHASGSGDRGGVELGQPLLKLIFYMCFSLGLDKIGQIGAAVRQLDGELDGGGRGGVRYVGFRRHGIRIDTAAFRAAGKYSILDVMQADRAPMRKDEVMLAGIGRAVICPHIAARPKAMAFFCGVAENYD